VYSALGAWVRSELAIALGAKHTEDAELLCDDHQRTSVPGLYAAGDVVYTLNQIAVAVGQAAIAATDIHNALREGRWDRLMRLPRRWRPVGTRCGAPPAVLVPNHQVFYPFPLCRCAAEDKRAPHPC
jgi:NADPH-dependent 2,4-dienoyl-CoA reductase/sulfur reductase-like enzyme